MDAPTSLRHEYDDHADEVLGCAILGHLKKPSQEMAPFLNADTPQGETLK